MLKYFSFFIFILFTFSSHAYSNEHPMITTSIVDEDCNGNMWAEELLISKLKQIAREQCEKRALQASVTILKETFYCEDSKLEGDANYKCINMF